MHALRCDLCAQLLANLWEDLQLHGEGEGDVGGANDAKYDDSYAGSSASESETATPPPNDDRKKNVFAC